MMVLRTILRSIIIKNYKISLLAPLCTCKYLNTTFGPIYMSRKISRDEIINNSSGSIRAKEKLILQLNLKSTEDAVAFYKLPIQTLYLIYKTTKDDAERKYCDNRLYYLAKHINCSPTVLSNLLVKRSFVYSLSFDWLKNSLDVLLEMGVSGDRIQRDLWVLKYHHDTIRERLKIVKNAGIDTLYPWMVRCSESILKRFIDLSTETKIILGETQSTKIYLANRLHISPQAVEDIYIKIPALKSIRVTKVKMFLDFLIKEGFEAQEIANKPRVLTASQKTVQKRLEKLRKLGLNDINLNVLCRSRKGFKRYCESLESLSDS